MKYLVAVSGGIDSVVLLDMLVNDRISLSVDTDVESQGERASPEFVVAHFDHGIRSDSADDARFVEELARRYGLEFVSRRESLGELASEDQARERRYAFLREQAMEQAATIVTAHHADDVIETVAINLTRGTGWRGLAVFGGQAVVRPLLRHTKSELRDYALDHRLEWVEDSTNAGDDYLRNRLRHRSARLLSAATRQQLLALWQAQLEVGRQIQREAKTFLRSDHTYDRYLLTQIDQATAEELLRMMIANAQGRPPTRPQASRALLHIKTARPGSTYQVGAQVDLVFTARTFVVRTP